MTLFCYYRSDMSFVMPNALNLILPKKLLLRICKHFCCFEVYFLVKFDNKSTLLMD